MSKIDALDVVVKAFGVGLLVAAIVAVPAMIEGVIAAQVLALHEPADGAEEFSSDIVRTARSTQIAASLGALVRFLVFSLASIEFLRPGSRVRRFVVGPSAQPSAGDLARPRAQDERP